MNHDTFFFKSLSPFLSLFRITFLIFQAYCFFYSFIYSVHTILKTLNPLTKTLHQFGNLFPAKQQQND